MLLKRITEVDPQKSKFKKHGGRGVVGSSKFTKHSVRIGLANWWRTDAGINMFPDLNNFCKTKQNKTTITYNFL